MKKYLVAGLLNGATSSFDDLEAAKCFSRSMSAKHYQQGKALYVFELIGTALFDPKGEFKEEPK